MWQAPNLANTRCTVTIMPGFFFFNFGIFQTLYICIFSFYYHICVKEDIIIINFYRHNTWALGNYMKVKSLKEGKCLVLFDDDIVPSSSNCFSLVHNVRTIEILQGFLEEYTSMLFIIKYLKSILGPGKSSDSGCLKLSMVPSIWLSW